jgi:hypothetical protein
MIVARVSELLFHSDEDRHTVAYDRRARQVIKDFSVSGHQLKLAIGEQEAVFTSLRKELEELLARAKVDPSDFGFRVSHSGVDEHGLFRECTFCTTGSEMPVVAERVRLDAAKDSDLPEKIQ